MIVALILVSILAILGWVTVIIIYLSKPLTIIETKVLTVEVPVAPKMDITVDSDLLVQSFIEAMQRELPQVVRSSTPTVMSLR